MFDGSGSIDLDGNIMGYRWDWTNDGIWDEPPSGWSESRTAAHGYSVEGTYTVKLQVTDNDDLIGNDTATVQITTTPLLPSDVYVDRNYYDDDHDGSHDWEYDAFNNIRDGITHVEDGGTVHVYSGTYGGVLIDKTVNLLGETKESTIIHTNGDSNPNADAIKITAAGVRVNGFTIENAGEGQFAAGIDIRSNNSNITGNIIQNNRNVGILLYFVSSNILRGNIIRNNYDGVLFYGGSGTRCSGNIIRNNMDQGIKLQGEHNIITWNTFYENQHGLYTYCSEHNTIHHNTFVRSDVLDTEDNVWYGESPNGFGGNYWYDWDGREYGIHDDYHGQYQQYEGSDGILDKGLEAGGGLNPYLVGSETWHRWDLYPLVHPCGNLVINNDTDEVFLSIQEAIDDPETDSGHTIFVSSGTYHENLVIDKSITLIGADKDHTILRGAGSGVAVEITTSGVTLTGFTIQNLPNPGYYTSGIYVYAVEGTTNTIITGNIIRDHTFYGIELLDSSDATISDNTFINNNIAAKFDGLGPTYQGITIRGNEFSMNTHAIALENHGVSNDIYENNFISNTVGLTIYDSWNNMIYHNNFIDNEQNARDEYNNQWYENGGGYHPPSGNYWSDYDEIDEGAWDHNNDMIVDVPKDIPPNGINKDYGPYIIPNGWTTVDPEDSEVTLYPTLHPVLVTCPGADEPPYINIIVHVENYQSVPLDDIPLEDFEFTVTPIGDTDWYRRDEQIPLPYTITFDHTIGSSYYFTITGDTSIVGNLTIEVTVRDQELNSVLLPCKSPDYFTDGNVDLCDFTIFSRDYGNSIWRSDFTGNDLVSLPDFVYFSKHYADHS
jgi:parallel beta-helix repeat protein